MPAGFLCPAGALGELRDRLGPDERWRIGLIVDLGLDALLAVLDTADADERLTLETVELRLPEGDPDGAVERVLAATGERPATRICIELSPATAGWEAGPAAVADRGLTAKVRCGGIETHLFPTAAQLAEANGRIAAAIDWIDEAFDTAEAEGASGVVLLMQADTFQGANETLAGFASIVERIEERSGSFDGPVLLLQGDSHIYTEDHPLTGANLTRIVVHGETLPGEYLRLTVDPHAASFFSWERVQI